VFVHCLCCLGAIFSRAPGSHLLIRALGSQGRPQGPPRVRSNKIIRFPIRCPIRSYYSMILLAHIPTLVHSKGVQIDPARVTRPAGEEAVLGKYGLETAQEEQHKGAYASGTR
jgi:hypothetical protein